MSVLGNNLLVQYYAQNSLSAKSYVQDGLIALWDGIENAGWGVHNNSAVVWKDLIGVRDFSLNTNEQGRASFTHNAFYMAKVADNNKWAAYSHTGTMTAYRTAEIVAQTTYGNFDWLNVGAKTRGFYIGSPSTSNDTFLQAGTGTPYHSLKNFNIDSPFCFSVVYDNNNIQASYPISMFYNGIEQEMSNTGYTSYVQNTEGITLGGRYVNVADYGGCGYTFCIRIYNRQLSSSEIAHNHNVDKIRFNLP